jgi:hypothetical protein
MDCNECVNFKAKQAKPKEPKVTVLTFDKDGKQGSYCFYGVPDWKRIEREMLEDGLMAVIVLNAPFDTGKRNVRISAASLLLGDGSVRHDMPFSKRVAIWVEGSQYDVGERIKDIQQAISDWRAKQPKEHYAGEPCNLPVSNNMRELAKTHWFVYDQKATSYKAGDITNNNTDTSIYRVVYDDHARASQAWILRAVPKVTITKEQAEAVNYAVLTRDQTKVTITQAIDSLVKPTPEPVKPKWRPRIGDEIYVEGYLYRYIGNEGDMKSPEES